MVRALGLEPSLVRGKGPVPYQSGVTRVVGREGIEPPVSDDGWSTASCAPWRDRPVRDRCGDRPRRQCLCGCQGAGVRAGGPARRQARKESNPRPSVLETAAPPWLEPKGDDAHDVVRVVREKRRELQARGAAPYRRPPEPLMAASRRPGFASWSRDRPGRHAYAPKLDRARPWSCVSAVSMRAIGEAMVGHRAEGVNGLSDASGLRPTRPRRSNLSRGATRRLSPR